MRCGLGGTDFLVEAQYRQCKSFGLTVHHRTVRIMRILFCKICILSSKNSFAFLETHWLLLQPFLLPFLKYLPQKWTHSWLPLSVLIEIWRAAYLPFDHAGADTFLIVTPSSVNLWTCDAEVNEQILAVGRRNHFPKSVELLGVMRSWGPALPGAEGDEARLYRKVTAPCFNEGTHKKVWQYGIERTSLVIREEWKCEGIPQPKSGTIVDIVKSCKAWVCGRTSLVKEMHLTVRKWNRRWQLFVVFATVGSWSSTRIESCLQALT